MCETEIKIAYIKKHVYKERKETIYVEVGEEKWIYIIIIYRKIKYNICHKNNGHKIGIQEAKVTKKKEKYI